MDECDIEQQRAETIEKFDVHLSSIDVKETLQNLYDLAFMHGAISRSTAALEKLEENRDREFTGMLLDKLGTIIDTLRELKRRDDD